MTCSSNKFLNQEALNHSYSLINGNFTQVYNNMATITPPYDKYFQKLNLYAVLNSARNSFLNLKHRNRMFLERVITVLERNYPVQGYTRKDMARDMAISERHLQRKLKHLLGVTPKNLVRSFRLNKAKQLIVTGTDINLASSSCGFSTSSHFSKCFKNEFEILPSALKNTP